MWVCSCNGINDREIREALAQPTVVDEVDVGEVCGAGTACGGCLPEVRRLCHEAAQTGPETRDTGQLVAIR